MPIINNTYAEMIYSNVPENDFPLYDKNVSYQINSVVMVTNQYDHSIYQSLVSNNLNNPISDTTKWLQLGRTNRWKLHDGALQSQTTNPGIIHKQYYVKGPCTTVAALNVNATSMQVRMYDLFEGLVYDKTISLLTSIAIDDPYEYFFAETNALSPDAIVSDLPAYSETIVEIILNAPSDIAACGALLLGQATKIGATQYGAKIGITDYSKKEQDQFGNYNIVQRPYRKTADFQIMVDNSIVDQLQITLAQYRSRPVLYIGSDHFSSTAIYGFYRGFDITISYPTASLCSINLEGLT